MKKQSPLANCRAALLPAQHLQTLAPLRASAGIQVIPGDPAWVAWDGDRPDVVAAVLAVPGSQLFEARAGGWFGPGAHVPAFALPPRGRLVPLDRVVVPAPIVPLGHQGGTPRQMPYALVRDERPRATSALRCAAADLQPWALTATTNDCARVSGAQCGATIWLRGERLPAVAGAARFWGDLVLLPLGFAVAGAWQDVDLRAAAGVDDNELLILTADGAEAIRLDAFMPVTRASLRRALSCSL